MRRVTSDEGPGSLLEQRIAYAARHPADDWLALHENVPEWPAGEVPEVLAAPRRLDEAVAYAPATGEPELRALVAELETARQGTPIGIDNVVITAGSLHGVHLAAGVSRGRVALVDGPVIASIAHLLRREGLEPVWLGRDHDAAAVAAPFGEDLALIYVNSPNNPTGAIAGRARIDELRAIARRHDAVVVVDAVYDWFAPAGLATHALLGDPTLADTVYVNSVSKGHGAPGLRVGWTLAGASRAFATAVAIEQEMIAVSGAMQAAAAALLRAGNAPLVARVAAHRAMLADRWPQELPGRLDLPDAVPHALLHLPGLDADLLADGLLVERRMTLVTAGNYRGLDGDFLRIPLGLPAAVLEAAIARLAGALPEWREADAGAVPIVR